MNYAEESLRLHEEWKGKIEVVSRVPVSTKDDLSLAYTPGVAQPCLEIQKDPTQSYDLTRRHNLCAVITDGSAVLGLGDIGPEAGMPVMEGKCVLFKAFGGVDAFPLCVKTKDVDEFVNAVALISGSFGGVNLEDISAPRCFEIERKLKEKCDIPMFHDDQHGTAVITLAGLTNALKVVGKRMEEVKVVINGAGAAAIAIAKLLLSAGCHGHHPVRPHRRHLRRPREGHELDQGGNGPGHQSATKQTGHAWPTCMAGRRRVHRRVRPRRRDHGDGQDHEPGRHHLRLCQPHAGDLPGRSQGRRGRSGLHRPAATIPTRSTTCWPSPASSGATFDVRASEINDEMKMAAAHALADLISDEELSADYIIPKAFDPRVGPAVAKAVAQAARDTGVARI